MVYVRDRVRDAVTRRVTAGLIAGALLCVYALAMPELHAYLGFSSTAFVALPIVVYTWAFGLRQGVIAAAVVGFALNPFLLLRIASATAAAPLEIILGCLPIGLLILFTAASVGLLDEAHRRLDRLNSDSLQSERILERKIHDRLEELLRLKSAFLNNMSHELRTPLTAILGFAEVLVEEVDAGHREFAERILSSGIRLQHTLNSLLEFAQLESGGLKLNVRRVDVAERVQAAVRTFDEAAREKGLDLTLYMPDEPVESELDPAWLDRALGCLLENAVKFTSEGNVRVDVSADQSRVYISVMDSGIGIAEDFLPHIFAEFRQESMGHARSYEGSGLGLSVARRLVELLGGSIDVKSRQGHGSTFSVSFPLAESELEAATNPTPLWHAVGTPSRIATVNRVLVLDDSPDTLALTRHQLRDRFIVKTADDAEAALALARADQFDAVVLDIGLRGGRNGVDVLHALRKLGPYRTVPAVALTAFSMPGEREYYLREGFDAYLSKPFTRQQLTETLDHLLDTRAAA